MSQTSNMAPMKWEDTEARRLLLDKYLRQHHAVQTHKQRDNIPRRSVENNLPVSIGQQQIWLTSQLISNVPVYNECTTLHLPGPLDVNVFERSFNEILRRHEAWRTCFPVELGEPFQHISPYQPCKLPVVDLRSMPEAEREAEALRLATADAKKPFDLASGPLLRALLIQLSDMDTRLFLVMHHIIFDGISLSQILLPELYTIYKAFLAGQPSPLPELPIQYADFSIWQREQIREETCSSHLAYWREQLTGAATSLNLPTDRPRPQIPTYHGAMYPFALSSDLTNAIKNLSQQENVTLFITMVAAFQTLLHRYSNQDDILIGTTTSARKHPDLQRLMGFFLNTIILRANLSGNPTFRDLLKQTRKTTLEAQTHQDVPFEYLIKELQPERNNGHNPLFQAMITLEPSLSIPPSGWTLTQMDVKTDTSKFDLYLELDERPEGILGRFEYNTDLFDEATIARMHQHFQILLQGIVDQPEQGILDLPLLTEDERRQLLVDWNETQAAEALLVNKPGIHHIFEEQVEKTPQAIAILYKEQQLTYKQLNERANQLAHRLQKLGVGVEEKVGICLERSPDMVVGLLGILKAGGAYVPLDPVYPKERLTLMLQDTQVATLITQKRFVDTLPTQGINVICLDSKQSDIAQEPTTNLVTEVTADNLAYVMYTSGSTGGPKGVEIRHCSIIRLLFDVDYVQLDATRTILHMAPISFDASTFELWGALLHGARCVLFPEALPTLNSISSVIHKYKITTAWLTASLFNTVIDEAPHALKGLQQVLTGGETLSVNHVRKALELLPSTQFINGYGPTECTTFACCYTIPRHIEPTMRSIPIGRPISNTQVYVVDTRLQPVPIGVPGELYLGGAGLARGYLNRPELTHEKFIVHPFSKEPGAFLYKTGDQVRYLPDGNLEFMGRFDKQVKLRGFRIELNEIEAALDSHAAVCKAFVVIHESTQGEKLLIAYYTLQNGERINDDELRHFLQKSLPEYMIPSHFIALEAFPLTINGKLDKRALPEPTKNVKKSSFVAPSKEEHYQLLQIWEELLDIRPIGIRDNFFYLGGHSLLAARLVDRIEQVFNKKISLSTLFAGPTIEQITDTLLRQESLKSHIPVITVQRGSADTSKRPFFFLHGDPNGGAFYCFNMARELGIEQQFYAVKPLQFTEAPSLPTLEAMARQHLESIRAIQPEGPYQLGGFCNGGLLAYEIARLLHADGQEVKLLALIDPSIPAFRSWTRIAFSFLGSMTRMSEERQLNWFLRLHYIYRYIRFASTRKYYLEQRHGRTIIELLRNILPPPIKELYNDWDELFRWILAGHTSGPYAGKVTFFWSSEAFPHRGWWHKTFKEEKLYVLPGTHWSWNSEYLRILTEPLRFCLNEAQDTSSE